MQQLQAKLKNVPTDASLVCGSTNNGLNKEETLSVQSKVRTCNNLEVNQLQHTGGLKAIVYVLSVEEKPLMPCTQTKARKLLKLKKATVYKLYPFTIKLMFECENKTQPVTFGIDSGYKTIGFSAVTDKKELVSGKLILDDKTHSRLTERRMYRRLKRGKLWYRKPRFSNRKKKEGWLPPSTQRRYETHLNLLHKYQNLLPIANVTIETANFDIQKINNPEINGVAYQQGSLYDYQNVRSYLMVREKGCCQICNKKFEKGNPSHIHHKKQHNEEGSNRPENLAIMHKKCHVDFHKKHLKLAASKQFKAETFMSIIQHKFEQDIPNVNITFGYKTFVDRNALGLLKTHSNDAFVIAGGSKQERTIPTTIKQKHRNNRAIQTNRNGFAPSIRKHRYSIQPNDTVTIANKKYFCVGVFNKGGYVRVKNDSEIFNFNIKKVQSVFNFGSLVWK